MAEKLTKKFKDFKGLFKDGAKSEKDPAKVGRGEPHDRDELRLWYRTKCFRDLNRRGQEAFFRFLRGDIYNEDMDVILVPVGAEGVDGNAKRYQFWLKCENLNLEDLFEDYIMDDSTKIKDASETFQQKDELKTNAVKVNKYVSKLKESMQPDLDGDFSKFTTYLEDYEKENMKS